MGSKQEGLQEAFDNRDEPTHSEMVADAGSKQEVSPYPSTYEMLKAIRDAGLDPAGMTDGERREAYDAVCDAGYADRPRHEVSPEMRAAHELQRGDRILLDGKQVIVSEVNDWSDSVFPDTATQVGIVYRQGSGEIERAVDRGALIVATAYPVYASGEEGPSFAVGRGASYRKALWDLQAYQADEWRRIEDDPRVVRIQVAVSEMVE